MISHLEAAEKAIRSAGRPLNAHELVQAIEGLGLAKFSGSTPHKTINARLSESISRNGERSPFVRTAHNRFSLRNTDWEATFTAKKRVIHPIDERIKAVPLAKLSDALIPRETDALYSLDRAAIVKIATDVARQDAEQRTDIVQLIPTFVVTKPGKVLKYQRTKRLPETRLHDTWSVNFGGHLQSDDFPVLFQDNEEMVDLFLMRELHEELEFDQTPIIKYLGGLYLTSSEFERQHIGLVFQISLSDDATVGSLEPGYHTNITEEPLDSILSSSQLDSWSRVVVTTLLAS